MVIGIMGAMPEEVDVIREQMNHVTEVKQGSRTYYQGNINGCDVVLVFSRWGKVAAATTATSLITHFKIERLIFTGVAGAASPELNIGDIVISGELYQHDMDPRPLFQKHEVPLTGMVLFKADIILVNKVLAAANALINNPQEKIPVKTLREFGIIAPRCLVGTIASGDQFIADAKRTKEILSEKSQTVAVEMEGAAVAQVCHDYAIPFVVIRTISDRADHGAVVDFPRFIEKIAKHYAEHIIRHVFAN